eukprot:TRINITY_DN27644_c0_g1_i1.p1 TRINITY_DN27644_c0_g1~~TRINITY_DN27644_c0_g1_i1.p1  ORF type:complete len:1042 (-),score=169.43 TRINITY_DN27644_c0_g1_i1:214-3171(-)
MESSVVGMSAVAPWDFGPPTGRGMRATRDIRKGDIYLRLPISQLVTPRRCRELLFRWMNISMSKSKCGGGETPMKQSLSSLQEITVGFSVLISDDADEVFAACRAAGIDADNDSARRDLLGVVTVVVSLDDSDDTVEVRRPADPDGDTVWFAVKALARPPLKAALSALPDETVLVTAIVAGRRWREQYEGDVTKTEAAAAAERDCCPGFPTLLPELPDEVGNVCEWSDEELCGFQGSLHAGVARRSRSEVVRCHEMVRGVILGAVGIELGPGEDPLAAPWGTLHDFAWAWPRVASRHRASSTFVRGLGCDEGKSLMAPGGPDLMNHSIHIRGTPTLESADGRFLELMALADFREGEQVFTTYGEQPNNALLCNWGFAIPANPYDRVEIVLGLDRLAAGAQSNVDSIANLRRELCLRALACAPPPSDVDSKAVVGGDCQLLGDNQHPELRIGLSLRDPLPGCLLSCSRLEQLSDIDLMALDKGLGRDELRKRLENGESFEPRSDVIEDGGCSRGDIALRCTGFRCELRALSALRKLFKSMLDGYPTTPPTASDGNPRSVARLACCAVLCESEKNILIAGLQEAERLIATALRNSLSAARLVGVGEEAGWRKYLAATKDEVEKRSQEVVSLYQALSALPPREPSETALIWTQTCSFLFMLVHGVLSRHADARVPYMPECWSYADGGDQAAVRSKTSGYEPTPCESRGVGDVCDTSVTATVAPRQWSRWGHNSPGCGSSVAHDCEFLVDTFLAKSAFWGCYLFAQFLTTASLNAQAISDMAGESIDIRKKNAWSVPTPEALELLASEAPLVEVGAGRGLWAHLLSRRGVEIRAFDLGRFDPVYCDVGTAGEDSGPGPTVSAETAAGDGFGGSSFDEVDFGGPEMLQGLGATCKALVLMWPDYGGVGSFGLECVRRWALDECGQRLILVGEWAGEGGTLGAFAPGLQAHGQSFSLACQSFVEEHFRLVRTLALPNWPLVLDAVRVFVRR